VQLLKTALLGGFQIERFDKLFDKNRIKLGGAKVEKINH
jgi:hypothetical protein